jgi:hypothetical protein
MSRTGEKLVEAKIPSSKCYFLLMVQNFDPHTINMEKTFLI